MNATQLDTPFVDGGLHVTNFFNGRILSREDLQREQDAARAIDERLGLALGDGIVRGLEVEAREIGGASLANPVVTVRAGLAVNRLGQTVALAGDVAVSLRKPVPPQSTGTKLAGSFDACAPSEQTVYVVGSGVYLLTIAPAQVKQGLALASGLNDGTATCNVKERVEGVTFRLVQVTLSASELADAARLRNVAAYKFLLADGAGTDAARDPFGAAPAAAQLTAAPVTECEVPLAILHWTNLGGLRWVDVWAVRRRARPRAAQDDWSRLAGSPRTAVGIAMVQQFQHHLWDLLVAQGSGLVARAAFTRLPPIGMIPLRFAGGPPGDASFFQGLKRSDPPAFLEGSRLPLLIDDAVRCGPLDLLAEEQELVWTYLVRENARARETESPASRPQGYLVFANGQVPYRGDARFDLAYWGYATFAME